MNYKYKNSSKGIGLIEVLITLVIVALGLLALASLESELMFSSGDNKARIEAKALAEAKIEELRDSINIGDVADTTDGNTGYLDRADLTAGTFSDTVTGTNAAFTREWTITNVAAFIVTAPDRKKISVRVKWGAESSEEKIFSVSEIAWADPAKGVLYSEEQSSDGTTAIPSPRQNASEDVASEQVFDVPNSIISANAVGDTTVTLGSVSDTANTQNEVNVVLTQIAANSHYYATDNSSLFFVDDGVIAVFLCEGTACTYIQNHFGGVVMRISGKVSSMSGELLDDILVAWSSSDVNACYQEATSTTSTVLKTGYNQNSTTLHTISYECVFAGNCDTTASSDGIGTGNGCSTVVTDTHISDRGVGPGGEFGEVGLLGVDDQGGDREQLCFLEDTADHNLTQNVLQYGAASGEQYDEDYAFPVTKRSYITRRRNVDNTESSEGINQSFTNHNFLLLDRATGGGVSETCSDLVALNSANANFELGPRDIIRVSSADNVVASEVAYAGGTGPAITLTGTASAATQLDLYVSSAHASNDEPGSCYIKSDGSAYACVVPSLSASVAIEGASSSYPSAKTAYSTCTRGVSATAPTLSAACVWPTATDFISPP